MSRRPLQNRRILITGASSGIGWELAKSLARPGNRLLITARREERLTALATEVSPRVTECIVRAGDITQETLRQQLVETVAQRWGGLDLLVNCAGIGAMGPFAQATSERLRTIFEVNFFAPVELTRGMLPWLGRGDRPMIVNISSVLGHRAVPNKSEYCASKFALHGFSDALRAELLPQGIDLLLVSPSTTDSEFFDAAIEDRVQADWKGRRPMPPERVARIATQAIRLGKHEVILSWGGKSLVWFDRLFPVWADYLTAKFAK